MTRNGVEYDLTKTPYFVESDNWIFYFSSKYYQGLFSERLGKYLDEYNNRLKRYLGYDVRCHSIAELKCYLSVEKRGCRAYYKPSLRYLQEGNVLLID